MKVRPKFKMISALLTIALALFCESTPSFGRDEEGSIEVENKRILAQKVLDVLSPFDDQFRILPGAPVKKQIERREAHVFTARSQTNESDSCDITAISDYYDSVTFNLDCKPQGGDTDLPLLYFPMPIYYGQSRFQLLQIGWINGAKPTRAFEVIKDRSGKITSLKETNRRVKTR